jgi:oligoribonuclease (3'-5' exoribonuclease)
MRKYCEHCKRDYAKNYFSKHLRSKKHLKNVEENNNINNKEYLIQKILEIDLTERDIEYIIQRLLNKKVKQKKKPLGNCCICLDDYHEDDYEKTICNHNFHIGCLHEWKKINSSCPYCRCLLL